MKARSENDRTTLIAIGMLAALGFATSGCASPERRQVPAELADHAQIPGMAGVRAQGDGAIASFWSSTAASIAQERTEDFPPGPDGRRTYPALALSGGGADGAFGAGVLNGWTESGTRPLFKIVTGISTGALIAPLAFLGPEYDPVLREEFTTIDTDDILETRILNVLYDDAIATAEPLARRLEKIVDAEFLARVAEAHARGRRLFIGTTNLDTQKFTIWDMGAIATFGTPEALALFREVMLASAAIPVAFSPAYITVEAGGELYDEMHVDGGVRASVFFNSFVSAFKDARERLGQPPARSELYIIRNGKTAPVYEEVAPRVIPIARRALTTLITSKAIGDLYRIHAYCRRDGIGFNYTTIPPEFEYESQEFFDRADMQRLFDLGCEMALEGKLWQHAPPGWDTDDDS
jgi:hypothetical protein